MKSLKQPCEQLLWSSFHREWNGGTEVNSVAPNYNAGKKEYSWDSNPGVSDSKSLVPNNHTVLPSDVAT